MNDRFLSCRGGSTVYSLSIPSDIVNGTWVWTIVPLDAGNTVSPNSVSQTYGTYKRFSYVPSSHGVVVVNANNQSVYFFKLDGSGVPNDYLFGGSFE